MKTSLVTPYVFAAIVVIVAANAGLTEMLGAHPFWSVSIAWIGVPVGLLLAMLLKLLRIGWRLRVAVTAVPLALTFAMATYGKQQFTASYAEDAFAGQLWYLGWIAVAIFASALISAALSPTHPTSDAR